MNKEIIEIEKNYFSSLHSQIDKLLFNINKNKKLSNKEIYMLSKFNKDLINITNLATQINNSLLKKNKNKLLKKDKDLLDDYDKDNKTIKNFLPYMMLYRMMLDKRQDCE